MRSLKFVVATTLLFALGFGLYKGTETIGPLGDRATSASASRSGPPSESAPASPASVPVASNPKKGSTPPTPAAAPIHIGVESIATGNPGDLNVDKTSPDRGQTPEPTLLTKPLQSHGVGSGWLNLAPADRSTGPKSLNLEGDRLSSTPSSHSPTVIAITLEDATPPSSQIGSVDDNSPSSEFPKSLGVSDPLEIDLLKPPNPDPLSTAKSPDTAVPEPGTVTGLLMVGILGVGAIAKRKWAKQGTGQ